MQNRSKQRVIEKCLALMTGLLNDCVSTYPQLKAKIDDAIDTLKLKHLVKLEDHGNWRRIHQEDPIKLANGRRPKEFWDDLETVLLYIERKSNGKVPAFNAGRRVVRYAVFPCQDTILPLHFETAYYNEQYKVEFKPYDNWDGGLSAVLSEDIEAALHNFAVAVAYNSLHTHKPPLYFWPFFSFNGYGIFVKRKALIEFARERGKIVNSFNNLSTREKQDFFITSKKLVERNTDFEWILKSYCKEKLHFDPEHLEAFHNNLTLIDCNTNVAKIEYVTHDDYTIYCTNPIHIHDLLLRTDEIGDPLYELIAHGDELTNHKNFNGLLVRSDFYHESEENKKIIEDLVSKWFLHINVFAERIEHARQHPAEAAKSFDITSLITFLNTRTKSKITVEHLPQVFGYNNFYKSQEDAFTAFFDETLDDPKNLKSYIELTTLALSQYPGRDMTIIRDMIVELKESMTNL